MKDFVVTHFGEYFESTRQKLYCQLNEEKNLRKITESFYSFQTMLDEVKKYVELIKKMQETKIMMQSCSSDNCVLIYNIKILNLFNPELQLINTKPKIKNKLEDLLRELKRSKVQEILV